MRDDRMDATPDAWRVCATERHRLVIAPAAGGRILSWQTRLDEGLRDWLIPITASDWPANIWPKGGLFPLMPFSNRVRDARLQGYGAPIALEAAHQSTHALHGQAQAMRWKVLHETASTVTLGLEHPRGHGGWPWRWQGRQTFMLDDHGLTIGLTLTNTDTRPMPAGIGLHPYFSASGVRLNATTEWVHDHELAQYSQPGTQTAWARGSDTWTRFLSDWNHHAHLTWPSGPGLRLQASESLSHLVLHGNQGRYLCVEPASHVCDAFNLAAAGQTGTGARTLAPGESLEGTLALQIT